MLRSLATAQKSLTLGNKLSAIMKKVVSSIQHLLSWSLPE